MSSLLFDKTQLVNLEYSLPKEIILANPDGAYSNTTIIGCNTRKYHGLLIAPVRSIDGGRHVFLSNLHETVIQHGQEFNLGINKYPGEYNPKGHKYARYFEMSPVVKMVYRVGGVVLQKELLLLQDEARIMVRYTLLEAHSPTTLRLKPFLAFRSIHALSKSNMFANMRIGKANNGFSSRLYSEYPELFMQTSRKSSFTAAPDWYLNVQYPKEEIRGYEHDEDLFVPGFFEMPIRQGEPVVVTAGFNPTPTNQLSRKFDAVVKDNEVRGSMISMLSHSAQLFIQNREKGPEIISGYPWFGRWGRHSFIALPGLVLSRGQKELAVTILKTMEKRRKGAVFPDHSPDFTKPVHRAADTSLWFIWAVQQLCGPEGKSSEYFNTFSGSIYAIISAYLERKVDGIQIDERGLLHAYTEGKALTWMDSYLDGKPVTQRPGYAIEINALWYNAVCFAEAGAKHTQNKRMIKKLSGLKEKLDESMTMFWDDDRGYLADYIFEDKAKWDVRPNMLLAVAMPCSPYSDEQKNAVLEVVRQELLTDKGIRSLSPRSADFKQSYEGDHHKRDLAYHQGTVWPWLLGSFAGAWLKIHGESGRSFVAGILENFEEEMLEHGLGMVSEVHDGSPPHRACGAIAFASSVGELLRIQELLTNLG